MGIISVLEEVSERCRRCSVRRLTCPRASWNELCPDCAATLELLMPVTATAPRMRNQDHQAHRLWDNESQAWSLVFKHIINGARRNANKIAKAWGLLITLEGKPYGATTVFSDLRNRHAYGPYPHCISGTETITDRIIKFIVG